MRAFNLTILFAAAFVVWSGAGCESDEQTNRYEGLCDSPETVAEASLPTGVYYNPDGSLDYAILPHGAKVTPFGQYLKMGTFAAGVAISPDGRFIAVVNNGARDLSLANPQNQSIIITSLETFEIIQVIEMPELFFGLAFSPGGDRLYVSGGVRDIINVFDSTDIPFAKIAEIPCAYPYGLAVSPDGSRLLAAESHYSQIAVFDTEDYRRLGEIFTGPFPFQIVFGAEDATAYVSNVGGRSVSVINPQTLEKVADIEVGKNPEGMAFGGGYLYVANSDDDTISVIDAGTSQAIDLYTLNDDPEAPPGITPTDVKLSYDGEYLLITAAGDNSVIFLDAKTGSRIGAAPTAYYPIEVEAYGGMVIVLSAKGLGSGPAHLDQYGDSIEMGAFYGGLQIFPMPDRPELQLLNETVDRNNDFAVEEYEARCSYSKNPIPLRTGGPSPIKHVIYLVRENKTYDSLLGTMNGGARDQWHEPEMALFGVGVTIAINPAGYDSDTRFNITANLHKLSREFVDVVNFYTESDKSTTGHIWLTAGITNDFTERAWLPFQTRSGGDKQFIAASVDEVSESAMGHIFHHLIEHGKSIRVYGEFTGSAGTLFGETFDYIAHDYIPGMTGVDDSKRIEPLLRDIREGRLSDFTYIWTPNDHTYGMSANRPHPAYMVADTDLAAGLIVEAISESKYWNDSVIFIVEDDPQSTPDHIDTHRSICVAAGPYVKRGEISTVHYSFSSLHNTMFRILGVPPITRYVARATPMYDLFTDTPDYTTYRSVRKDSKLADKEAWTIKPGSPLTGHSMALRFDEVDRFNPELGPILWKAFKGLDAEFPAELAGGEAD